MHFRSIRRAVVCSALALLAACQSTTAPSRAGELHGTWAGEAWDGKAHAWVANDSLHVFGAPSGVMGGPYVSVVVGAFGGPGTYPLGPSAAEVNYATGGDVISATYRSTQPGAGTLVVTGVRGGRVTGRVEFVADVQPRGYAPAGERARFEGEFHARTRASRVPRW